MSAAEHAAATTGPANSTEFITHHLTHLSVGEGFWTWHIDTIFMSVLTGVMALGLFWAAARKATSGVPGKGQAFNRVRVRNLKTGRTVEKTWKSGDSVESADVMDVDMQYLYQDGDFYHFMVPDNFEQHTASKEAVGDSSQWLKDGVTCIVTLWNGVPLVVTPPAHIEATIVETDPGVRGDTATGGQKPAKLETGAVVRVPLFINQGEVIKVDTRTGEYISRAKS